MGKRNQKKQLYRLKMGMVHWLLSLPRPWKTGFEMSAATHLVTAQTTYAQPSREIDKCLPNSPLNQ